jgi:hypothetical protein
MDRIPTDPAELLPWYVNGSLPDEARARVDTLLRERPELAAELVWLQNLQRTLRAPTWQVSDEIGLARTLKRIRADAVVDAAGAAPAASARRVAVPPTVAERVRAWLAGMALSPAFAVAALVIVVQAGVIASLAGGDNEYAQVRALPAAAVPDGQLFRLAFKPDASEADIRLLLIGVQGNIEAGPGQLGDYHVRVPAALAGRAGATLKAAPIVDAVQPVDAVPPRGH